MSGSPAPAARLSETRDVGQNPLREQRVMTDDLEPSPAPGYYVTGTLASRVRLPQEGPCECDLYLTCAKAVTTARRAASARRGRKHSSAVVLVAWQESEVAASERRDGPEVALVEGQQALGTEPSGQDYNRSVCQP
jgi:hypothetical protein